MYSLPSIVIVVKEQPCNTEWGGPKDLEKSRKMERLEEKAEMGSEVVELEWWVVRVWRFRIFGWYGIALDESSNCQPKDRHAISRRSRPCILLKQ